MKNVIALKEIKLWLIEMVGKLFKLGFIELKGNDMTKECGVLLKNGKIKWKTPGKEKSKILVCFSSKLGNVDGCGKGGGSLFNSQLLYFI